MSIIGDPHDGELAGAVVGRALRALEPEDENRVDEHLRGCAACRALLSQTHETMALLARSVPPAEPPPGLRGRILEAAAAEPDPPRVSRPLPTPAAGAPAPVPTRTVPVEQARAAGPASRVPRRRTAALLALVAVVAGVVVFSARGAVQGGGDDPRSVAAARAQQVVESAEARDPAVKHASLIQPGGSVMAVVLDDTTGARVVPVDMPDIGAGRTFVLWRVAGGGASAVGTFDGSGSYTPVGTTTTPSTDGPSTLSQGAYAVSAEPVGPVPARPSAVVASGPLI